MSILEDIYGAGMSGLGYLGNVLDTPGSFARGLLSGNVKRAFTGILNPEDRVSGRELIGMQDDPSSWSDDILGFGAEVLTDPLLLVGGSLGKAGKIAEKAGVVPKAVYKASGELAQGARELAASSTLRDLYKASPEAAEAIKNATSGGRRSIYETVTGAPKMAEQAKQMVADAASGAANKTLDEPLRKGVFTFAGQGVGGGVDTAKKIDKAVDAVMLGDWKLPLNVAGKLIDKSNNWKDVEVPNVIRSQITPRFDKSVNDATTRMGQVFNRSLEAEREATKAGVKGQLFEAADAWQKNKPLLDANVDAVTNYFELGTPLPPQLQGMQSHFDTIKKAMDSSYSEREFMGLKSPRIDTTSSTAPLDYFPRQSTDEALPDAFKFIKEANKVSPTKVNSASPRADWSTGSPRSALRAMGRDADIFTLNATQPVDRAREIFAKKLRDHYGFQGFDDSVYQTASALGQDEISNRIAGLEQRLASARPGSPASLSIQAQIDGHKDMLKQLDIFDTSGEAAEVMLKRAAGKTKDTLDPLFNTNPLEDASKYLSSVQDSTTVADEVLGSLHGNFVKKKFSKMTPDVQKDYMGINEALVHLGFGKDSANATDEAVQQLAMRLQMRPEKLMKGAIPKSVVDELGRTINRVSGPESVTSAGKAFDKITSVFKAYALMRPNFPVRNAIGGQIMNQMEGMGSWASKKAMDKILKGETVEGLAKQIPEFTAAGMDDIAATEELRKRLFKNGMADRSVGQMSDLPGVPNENVTRGVPGAEPISAWNVVKGFKNFTSPKYRKDNPGWWNPPKTRGIIGDKSEFALANATQDANYWTEAMNRGSGYIDKLSQGYADDAASKVVGDAHVRYDDMTSFEKQVLRRIFPFYSFSKGMAKYAGKKLANEPGGPLAQTLRGINVMHGEGPLPDQIADTAAIPTGTDDEGSPTFLTGLGLMPEDALRLIGSLPPWGEGSGKEIGKQLNPLIKGPLEALSGRSLFYGGASGGRDIRDADPVIGRIGSNIFGGEPADTRAIDNVIMNSLPTPLATLKTATDPRRSLLGRAAQLATGVKSNSVPERTSDALKREKLEDALREIPGTRKYSKVNLSKEALDKLDPEERARAVEIQGLLKNLAERAKVRAKEKKAS